MSLTFNQNYFMSSMPNIRNNSDIRQPQVEAYYKTIEYFASEYEQRNALIVLPTGVGKTGVMGLIPFGLCKKRVLIITPGNTIRDTVLESLNPMNPKNFWYKRKIFEIGLPLPNVIEYEGNDTPNEVLNVANIVILNIQKLQSRFNSSLINRVDSDFFDLIIIDEAHHSVATTWTECVNYFSDAKIVKLTGTPFRTDKEQIVGKLIYKYPLSRAMHHDYVKSLSNIQYTPDELKLTIDNDSNKFYTLDEIYNLGLRDQDWITRSVALSDECSESIVITSIKYLEEKKLTSSIPHKIIAIACSIEHAKKIASLYEKHGIKTAIVHSKLSDEEKEIAFKNINNHRVEAIINVAMLGEGYDHPYLSIAAIFRPFRNELPYTQFIGRVLRKIPEGSAKDNIAIIISHEHLYLNKLWEKYKKEIQESEIIASLKNYDDMLDKTLDDPDDPKEINHHEPIELGNILQSDSHKLTVENYLDTDLIRKSKEDEFKMQEQIKKLLETLPGISEDYAKSIIYQSQSASSDLGRPDLLYKRKKKGLDVTIREELVPNIIEKYHIDKDDDSLRNCTLFTGPYWYIPNTVLKSNSPGKNTAMLAMYYNKFLRDKIGIPRKQWSDSDFDIAFKELDSLTEYIEGIIKMYYNL